jgi:6,7-dimethyl-8-ribityllumazine synthase
MAEPRRDASKPPVLLRGGRILVVEARFYEAIGARLLEGARRAIDAAGAACEVINVPGALEIPIAISMALDAAAARAVHPYDGVVALGCVIRGETYHFEIVAGESSRALIDLAIARGLALGNGILTVENEAQAQARADPKRGDKGGDAARAAIALAALKRELGAKNPAAKKSGAAR